MTAGAASSSGRALARTALIAVAQLRSTRDKRSNLLNVARCAGWAKRDGAQMLFLPECLGFMGDSAEHTLGQADPPIDNMLLGKRLSSSTATPFRRALSDTITKYAARPGLDVDVDVDDCGDQETTSIPSIIEELRFIACESNLWISGGGVHTSCEPPSDQLDTTTKSSTDNQPRKKIYNTHVIIDSSGEIKAHYHKIHLFDVSIPDKKVNLRESNTTSPGKNLVVCDSPVGKLGLTICYDMRFSEMYVDLVQNMGAEVLLMPSAFTVPTGKAHWHALLKARAIESQCYVIAAAQVGKHNEKRQSYGHSVVYDPWGELVADAGGYDGSGTVDRSETQNHSTTDIVDSPVCVPSIIMSEIDLDKLTSVRERMPIQQHRENSAFS